MWKWASLEAQRLLSKQDEEKRHELQQEKITEPHLGCSIVRGNGNYHAADECSGCRCTADKYNT